MVWIFDSSGLFVNVSAERIALVIVFRSSGRSEGGCDNEQEIFNSC
ncbi:MAG: hypothetical protein UW09_C0001G0158 [candidate division TM6 bacterium GW2011_GWF2_43_87]|nr:MAG: hypothetical protein UW09_C0001G0158 [candidate division TM6 bacterium GW2011_GWF2_43_87]